jgi:flagellar biosynthetic protein FliQ
VTPDFVISLGKEAIWMVLLIGAPMLGFGMVVGIVIAVLQSATQIQEMTLTFVPKIIAVFFALLLFFPWIVRTIVEFTERLFNNIPFYVG